MKTTTMALYNLIKQTAILVLLISIIPLNSCNKTSIPTNLNDYLEYAQDPDNGILKSKSVNGLILTLKWISPQEQLARFKRNSKNINLSKIQDSDMSKNLAFELTIEPEGSDEDLMLIGLTKYEEYKTRMNTLNFELSEFIELATATKIYKPALTNMENTFGLTKSRVFQIIFTPELEGDDEFYSSPILDFIFEDQEFGTGMHHFTFERNQINEVSNTNITIDQ